MFNVIVINLAYCVCCLFVLYSAPALWVSYIQYAESVYGANTQSLTNANHVEHMRDIIKKAISLAGYDIQQGIQYHCMLLLAIYVF